ncbi:MAG TPA: hypothetical protein VIL24_00870 [Clostridia bacterium]
MEKLLDYSIISRKFGDDISLQAFVDCMPYPIIIYKPDGVPAMVNKAFLKSYNIGSADEIVFFYNNIVIGFGVTLGSSLVELIKILKSAKYEISNDDSNENEPKSI